jgi:hypothetical protein
MTPTFMPDFGPPRNAIRGFPIGAESQKYKMEGSTELVINSSKAANEAVKLFASCSFVSSEFDAMLPI